MTELRLVDRESSIEVEYDGRALYSEDHLHLRQQELERLYKKSDVVCYCQPSGVRMHIKHRLDTGNYYLADNPTSPSHQMGCELEKSSRLMDDKQAEPESGEVTWELPDEFSLFKSSNSDSQNSNRNTSPRGHGQKRQPQPSLFKRLVYRLLDESFATFFHQSTTTAYTVAISINNQEDLLRDCSPANCNMEFKVHYGHRGHMILGKKLKQLRERGIDACGIWFEKADKVHVADGQLFYSIGEEHHKCQLAQNVNTPLMDGPYLLAGAFKAPEDGRWIQLRELLFLPLASTTCAIPVESEEERQFFLEAVHQVKRERVKKSYIGKRLRGWPIDGRTLPGPIFAGVRRGEKKRVITTMQKLSVKDAALYEHRFNAPLVPAIELLNFLEDHNES